jgi:hypothetical protein
MTEVLYWNMEEVNLKIAPTKVVLNVFSNAINYQLKFGGGSGPTISVYCRPHQGQVKMGFPPESTTVICSMFTTVMVVPPTPDW